MRVKAIIFVLLAVLFTPIANANLKLKIKWEYKLPKAKFAWQRIWQVKDMCVLLCDNSKNAISNTYQIHCLKMADGKPLWDRLDEKSGYLINISSFAFDEAVMMFLHVTADSVWFVKFDLARKCEISRQDATPFCFPSINRVVFGGYNGKHYWFFVGDYIIVLDAASGQKTFMSKVDNQLNIVSEGRVYVYTDKAKKVECWEMQSGKLLWERSLKTGYIRFFIEGGLKAYLFEKANPRDATSSLQCIDALKGSVVWSKSLEGDFRVFYADHEKLSLVHNLKNKKPIIKTLSAKDGKLISEFSLPGTDFSVEVHLSLILMKIDIFCRPSEIHGYDIKTGKRLWLRASNHLSSPITYGDKLYYLDGVMSGIRYLKRIDPKTGKTIWEISDKINDIFSKGSDLLVAQSDRITCYSDLN